MVKSLLCNSIICFLLNCCIVGQGLGAISTMLLDTGQTECFDSLYGGVIACPDEGEELYGQDANYKGVEHAFSKVTSNGDEVVLDNHQKIMWQYGGTDKKYNQTNAEDYCDALVFAGYGDWYLPDMKELESLAMYKQTGITSGGDRSYIHAVFPFTNSWFWSSSEAQGGLGTGRVVDFGVMTAIQAQSTSSSFFIRCARRIEPKAIVRELVVVGDRVYDKNKRLNWQKIPVSGKKWNEALEYCENLELDGYSSWRLPNIRELTSIIDLEQYSPTMDSQFEHPEEGRYYWSSTSNGSEAMMVDFEQGYHNRRSKTKSSDYYGPYLTRCVRGGLPKANAIHAVVPLLIGGGAGAGSGTGAGGSL